MPKAPPKAPSKAAAAPAQAPKPKAGDIAALRNSYKAQAATYRPQRPDEREHPVGRKGMLKGL